MARRTRRHARRRSSCPTHRPEERQVSVVSGHGKLRGRYCVKVKLGQADHVPTARHASRGACLAPTRMYGCFVSKAAASKKAAQVERKPAFR